MFPAYGFHQRTFNDFSSVVFGLYRGHSFDQVVISFNFMIVLAYVTPGVELELGPIRQIDNFRALDLQIKATHFYFYYKSILYKFFYV